MRFFCIQNTREWTWSSPREDLRCCVLGIIGLWLIFFQSFSLLLYFYGSLGFRILCKVSSFAIVQADPKLAESTGFGFGPQQSLHHWTFAIEPVTGYTLTVQRPFHEIHTPIWQKQKGYFNVCKCHNFPSSPPSCNPHLWMQSSIWRDL